MIAEVANEDGTIAAKDFFNLCKKVFKEDHCCPLKIAKRSLK